MRQDPITLERIKALHPKLRDEALKIYEEICLALTGAAMCRFAYTLRTFAEQDALYAQGRTKLFDNAGHRLGKVTNARAGQSFHNYGLAVDIVLLIDKDKNGTYESASWDMESDFDGDKMSDWKEIVKIFKAHGWEWGGDWTSLKDYPHFQKAFARKESDLLALYNAKKVDSHNYVLI